MTKILNIILNCVKVYNLKVKFKLLKSISITYYTLYFTKISFYFHRYFKILRNIKISFTVKYRKNNLISSPLLLHFVL